LFVRSLGEELEKHTNVDLHLMGEVAAVRQPEGEQIARRRRISFRRNIVPQGISR
jgi:hypothetical protein